MISQDQLRAIFTYDPNTGHLFWVAHPTAPYMNGRRAGGSDATAKTASVCGLMNRPKSTISRRRPNMNTAPLPPYAKGWRRFFPTRMRMAIALRLMRYGQSLAAWVAPEIRGEE